MLNYECSPILNYKCSPMLNQCLIVSAVLCWINAQLLMQSYTELQVQS
jgi:hypothetical protein